MKNNCFFILPLEPPGPIATMHPFSYLSFPPQGVSTLSSIPSTLVFLWHQLSPRPSLNTEDSFYPSIIDRLFLDSICIIRLDDKFGVKMNQKIECCIGGIRRRRRPWMRFRVLWVLHLDCLWDCCRQSSLLLLFSLCLWVWSSTATLLSAIW